jgi:CDP-paratose 2-epimerase
VPSGTLRAMSTAVITGSAGLIGSEAARHFAGAGSHVVGVDNDLRRVFFGDESSTAWMALELERELAERYTHVGLDIRDRDGIDALFAEYGTDISLVVHTAAQPSHDWAAREPFTDFDVNAVGTLTLLEATRRHCPDAVFVFTSTNKVYGDTPNRLPLIEQDTRWEIDPDHTYASGIREDMPIDATLHSIFGASKVAADVMVQEYGRYFGMQTSVFRGGTLTGPNHAAAELHGFLAYVMQCTMTGTPYRVFGYGGKQVRDAIHSADLISCFDHVHRHAVDHPDQRRCGEVYNIGGGRFSNCSVLEAISLCEEITGRRLDWSYVDDHRVGDHVWWIGDNGRFADHHPGWELTRDVTAILTEMHDANRDRWTATARAR